MTDEMQDTRHPLLTSSFRDCDSAERAYNDIVARGYSEDQIHVLMSEETRKLHFTKDGEVTDMGNKSREGLRDRAQQRRHRAWGESQDR